ncbi:unnamed protein product [Cochlearia groenlandica]
MFVSSTDQSFSNIPSSSSSSSPSFLHLTKPSDVELGQSHLSTFSIRDYVFTSRSKNFKKSWPFSSTSLQLCLKHGLSDPLPPIQAPKALSLNKPSVGTISYNRKSEKLGSNHTLVKTKEGFENGLLASGSKSKLQVAMVNKNPKKKIGCMDSVSKDDHNCIFAASESMALRTCPICKSFSSASNTTLNAHIDQCLSLDSEKQLISKPRRPKVKPRTKLKSMIDIYATAKECTLEDLDRRNGTKWAMVSSKSNRVVVSDNKHEVSSKGRKRSVLRVCVDHEDASGIGPVYIDGKGQKLRILSEFNKKASDPSREHEDVSEKEAYSDGKGSKRFKKSLGGKKHYKYDCKQPLQSKKLDVRKVNALEIKEYKRSMKRSESPGKGQQRTNKHSMLTKRRLSRYRNQKGTSDQPSENAHPLSEDPFVLRGSSSVSNDASVKVSSSLNSQDSWRVCEESQVVSGKSSSLSRRSPSFQANPLSCSRPVDKASASEVKGFMKLQKPRFEFSEDEYDDEETEKWESGMTQNRKLSDYEEWDKAVLSTDPSISGEECDYKSYEDIGNNKRDDDDMLDITDDAEAEFESMVRGCETTGQESSFVEVDMIPIPGPPGSFVPSPWDMGTNAIENHGNSSVITSQVLSSQDQLRNSPESPVSNFTAHETQGFHNIMAIEKRPSSRFRDIDDQSCCCQRKDKAFKDITSGSLHMIQHKLGSQSKPGIAVPSSSNPVLRLMGKDLMVISQRVEPSDDESSLKPTSQSLDVSKTHQVPPSLHCLSFDTSFYNIP